VSSRQRNLDAAVAAWNDGDLDGYLALYDDAIILHGYTPEPMNKTAVRGFYERILAAFHNSKLVFHDIIWSDDKAAIRFTMTGVHQADFMGVPASGVRSSYPGSRSCASRTTASSSGGRKQTCSACSSNSARFRHRPDRSSPPTAWLIANPRCVPVTRPATRPRGSSATGPRDPRRARLDEQRAAA